MCRGNARCELCPVTARLRPASVALGRGGHRSRRPHSGRGPVLRSRRGEQRLQCDGCRESVLRSRSQPVLTSLAARRAAHRRRPHPQ